MSSGPSRASSPGPTCWRPLPAICRRSTPAARPKVTPREDGSYLIDAFVPFSDVMQLIGLGEVPSGDYVTLAGFVLSQLHELPKPGDHFAFGGWRFEVVDMDGRRIDMILVQRQPDETAAIET